MKKNTNLKKALLTLVLALSILPVLPGTLPPANPVLEEPEQADFTEEEPGVQPLDDRDHKEKFDK